MTSGGFFYLTNEPITSNDCFVNCGYHQPDKSAGNNTKWVYKLIQFYLVKNHLSQILRMAIFKN